MVVEAVHGPHTPKATVLCVVWVRPVCGRRSGPAVHVWAGPAPGSWCRPQVVRGQQDSPNHPLPRFNAGELAGRDLEQRVDGRW